MTYRPPTNPCSHVFELMASDGLTDSYRCDDCLEVRHVEHGGEPARGVIQFPGHFKCIEHGRYNCAEDHAMQPEATKASPDR